MNDKKQVENATPVVENNPKPAEKDLISSEDVLAVISGDQVALVEQMERAKEAALSQKSNAQEAAAEKAKKKLEEEEKKKKAIMDEVKRRKAEALRKEQLAREEAERKRQAAEAERQRQLAEKKRLEEEAKAKAEQERLEAERKKKEKEAEIQARIDAKKAKEQARIDARQAKIDAREARRKAKIEAKEKAKKAKEDAKKAKIEAREKAKKDREALKKAKAEARKSKASKKVKNVSSVAAPVSQTVNSVSKSAVPPMATSNISSSPVSSSGSKNSLPNTRSISSNSVPVNLSSTVFGNGSSQTIPTSNTAVVPVKESANLHASSQKSAVIPSPASQKVVNSSVNTGNKKDGNSSNKSKKKESNLKYYMTFLFLALLIWMVAFLPEISSFVSGYFDSKKNAEVPTITAGTLTCKLGTNDNKYDYYYVAEFNFRDNKMYRFTFTSTTKGDQNLDAAELSAMKSSCDLLQEQIANLDGIDVSCSLSNGVYENIQKFSYETLKEKEVTTAYLEAGGTYPNYQYNQDIGKIEKEMNASNYTCERHN